MYEILFNLARDKIKQLSLLLIPVITVITSVFNLVNLVHDTFKKEKIQASSLSWDKMIY